MNKYLDQDKRIELIDLTYDLISAVTKDTKNLHLTNIATSFHNKIVDIDRLFKNNNKDIETSLLYTSINTYLLNNLTEGTQILKELYENTKEEKIMTLNKFIKKYNTMNKLIKKYESVEKDIRYFNIEEDIEKVFEEREDFYDIPSNIINFYNAELKQLGIDTEISNQNKHQKTKQKHIR